MKSESTFSMYPMQSRSQPQLLGARQTNKYKNISAQILNSRSSEMTLKLFLGISGFSLSRLLFTEYIAICRCPIPMIPLMSPYTTKDRSPKLFSIKREILILLINGRRIYPFNKGLRIYGGVYHPPFNTLKIGISTDDIKLKLYR